MKIYNTQAEVDADTVDGNLRVDCDVKFTFSVFMKGDISAINIIAKNISALGDISARDISAWGNISAGDISFYAICFAYLKITCKSIVGRRKNSRYFSLDEQVVVDGKVEE